MLPIESFSVELVSDYLGQLPIYLFPDEGSRMSVESLEREMEVIGVTARERVLGDPDMLDIIFSYLDPRSVKTVRLVSRYDYQMIPIK